MVVPAAAVPRALSLSVSRKPPNTSTGPVKLFAVPIASVLVPDLTMLAAPLIFPAPLIENELLPEALVITAGKTLTPEPIVIPVTTPSVSSSKAVSPARKTDGALLWTSVQFVTMESHVVSEVEVHRRSEPALAVTFKETEPGIDVSNVTGKCVPRTVGLKLPDRVPE